LATVGVDGTVRLRDTATGKEILKFEIPLQGPALRTFFSSDGEILAAVRPKGEVALWNVAAGKVVRSFKGDDADVLIAAISADRRVLATGSANGNIRVWDVPSGNVRSWKKKREVMKTEPARALAFTPDGHYLVSGHPNGMRVWELATGE